MDRREIFAANFKELHPKFSRMHAYLLDKLGLTLSQYSLLSQLVALGEVPMTEVSRHLRITKPAVTNLVDKLEERQFLKRVPDSRDRRVIHLKILEKGTKVVSKLQEQGLEVLLKAFDRFNTAEHETIGRFYKTLSKVLDDFILKAHP